MSPGTLTEAIDHFRERVLQDALVEATATYWRRRAEEFRAVGNPTCDAIAEACENRARVSVLGGDVEEFYRDIDAVNSEGAQDRLRRPRLVSTRTGPLARVRRQQQLPRLPTDHLRCLRPARSEREAKLEHGELARYLIRKDGTLTERRIVWRAIEAAVRLGYLSAGSKQLCLVVSSHQVQGGKGSADARCKRDHTIRAQQNVRNDGGRFTPTPPISSTNNPDPQEGAA